ncbi:MAG TPA: hypothetical protein VHT91_34395 [Kofleriaceae bacterium]|nr:hypothetical protein [Kofleriaceae bacterium]
MNKIAIAFLAAMSLASFGCKKKGGAGEAMDMMKKYKADLCACKDHDMDCGKKATDAYQKATADYAAKNPADKGDTTAKPDPEMEKLTTEVADCSKRVMTPDMGAAGGAGGAAAAPAAGSDTAAPAAAAPAAGSDTAAPAAGTPPAGDNAGSGSAAK